MILNAVLPPIHNPIDYKIKSYLIQMLIIINIMNTPIFSPVPNHKDWKTNNIHVTPVANGEVLPN